MTEGNPTVEEARRRVMRQSHQTGESCPMCEREIYALIEAVRQEERERMLRESASSCRHMWVSAATTDAVLSCGLCGVERGEV